MNREDVIVWCANAGMQWDSPTENTRRFFGKYGAIAGAIFQASPGTWEAFKTKEWIGDYVSEQDAKNAVEHAFADLYSMPYPI